MCRLLVKSDSSDDSRSMSFQRGDILGVFDDSHEFSQWDVQGLNLIELPGIDKNYYLYCLSSEYSRSRIRIKNVSSRMSMILQKIPKNIIRLRIYYYDADKKQILRK